MNIQKPSFVKNREISFEDADEIRKWIARKLWYSFRSDVRRRLREYREGSSALIKN